MPFQIIRNDITKVRADAIVNTANPEPAVGSGTDSAVYHAAGEKKLLAARAKIGNISPGSVAYTRAFRLNAKYIIHTVGPVWIDGEHGERTILRACYANSLALAAELKCESVAFPLIATGTYGFPKDEALQLALAEINKFLLAHDMNVILVVLDRGSFELSARLTGDIREYIDSHTAEALCSAEYGADHSVNTARLRRAYENARPARPVGAGYAKLSEIKPDVLPEAQLEETPAEAEDDAAPDHVMQGAGAAAAANMSDAQMMDEEAALPTESFGIMASAAAPTPAPERKKYAQAIPAAADVFPPNVSGKSLDEVVGSTADTFQERLLHLIDASGMTDVTVYKKANIDRKVFSRIRCKRDYKPKKKTAVAFAIALELDMPTMLDLLARAEIAFSPSSKFDLIITYFVTNKKYDIYEINSALFKYGQPLLGE